MFTSTYMKEKCMSVCLLERLSLQNGLSEKKTDDTITFAIGFRDGSYATIEVNREKKTIV